MYFSIPSLQKSFLKAFTCAAWTLSANALAVLILSAFTTVVPVQAQTTIPIVVTYGGKNPWLNARTSPWADPQNSNLIPGCKIPKGAVLTATDFEFKEGLPYCKVSVATIPGCPDDGEVWIAGGVQQVQEQTLYVDPQYSSQSEKMTSAAKGPCLACPKNESDKKISEMATDFIKKGIQISAPVWFQPCDNNKKCNCRGLTSEFGNRQRPQGFGSKNHKGVDLSAGDGQPIYSTADGVVTSAARAGGRGRRIEIDHFDSMLAPESQIIKDRTGHIIGAKEGQYVVVRACGMHKLERVTKLSTTYSHLLRYAPGIKAGTIVKKGQLIGFSDSSGSVTGPHLHFETDVEGLDCHQVNYGSMCDPRYFHGFPPWTKGDKDKFHCSKELK